MKSEEFAPSALSRRLNRVASRKSQVARDVISGNVIGGRVSALHTELKSRFQKYALRSKAPRSNTQHPTPNIQSIAMQHIPKFSILYSPFSIRKQSFRCFSFITHHSSLDTRKERLCRSF